MYHEAIMLRILHQIFRTGVVTEPLPSEVEAEIVEIGEDLEKAIRRKFHRRLTIRQVDAGSCNGCELEIHAMNNAIYNCERFGITFTASPRFADMLLVTGPVSMNMEIALKRTYHATPNPKIVVAVGDCGCNGGIFGESYASLGRISNVIPVDAEIPGCPPAPVDLLVGILKIIGDKA
jgi:Ni,Fe-hydrogenase III small subunit